MIKDFKYVVTRQDVEENMEIKDFLRKRFNFSSRLITKIKKNKGIYLDGEEVPGWISPKEGSVITVKIPDEKSNFEPADIPIDVAYEDNDLLIINKQPGVIVHPTASHPHNTIANGIAQYMIDTDQSFKLRFVNRLDRDTSGLLVLGKNSHCQAKISQQMKDNEVEKRYVALVHGIIDEDNGTIDLPIGRPGDVGIKRCVYPEGSPSVTHYKVLERYFPRDRKPSNPLDRTELDTKLHQEYTKKHEEFLEANPDKRELYEYLAQNDSPNEIVHQAGFTLVELKLETGRTHQIRVHLSHIGYPIVGDTLYGSSSDLIDRQALHARFLSLRQPVSDQVLNIEAALPADMEAAIKQI